MPAQISTILNYENWPEIDKRKWEWRFAQRDRFDDLSIEWSPKTLDLRRRCNSVWLGFLLFTDPAKLSVTPPDRVTADSISVFIAYLRQSCRTPTIYNYVSGLCQVLIKMYPNYDWSWLQIVCSNLKEQWVRKQKPEVLSPALFKCGLRLMETAEYRRQRYGTYDSSLIRRFRDGAMIATLVEAPMRLGPFLQMRLSELVRSNDTLIIHIPAERTKTNYGQDYPLSAALSDYLETYIQEVRPLYVASGSTDILWISDHGPLRYSTVWAIFYKRTRYSLGFPVNPHQFRHASATYLSRTDPENALAARDLLGHADFDMTSDYIQGAQTLGAALGAAEILEKRKQRLFDQSNP